MRMVVTAAKHHDAPAPMMAMCMCGRSMGGKTIIVYGSKRGNDGQYGHRAEKTTGNLLDDKDAGDDGNKDIYIICEIGIHK